MRIEIPYRDHPRPTLPVKGGATKDKEDSRMKAASC